jgi:hypothetical protein
MTTPTIRSRNRKTERAHDKATSAERLDVDVWRRRAAAWPEYETELLAEAARAETRQQTAA